ncbi:DUF3177 family protein [Geitlerinema sp. PCC 7407]|uniref:DUF3177 family protein n=1 Tax=Geitlerinema sp. PCC 7407 TaxID=1173025 RepID=UPI00029F8D92|nr:DUF3177 family protein [Geitlerinema sp. PCC 7407]AFY68204.1 hypothetical protein GEI7407_3737 [Geitlerinema sp. PCC 7407]
MEFELFRSLVWTDYRLAVLLTVILPLIGLIWAFVKNSEAILRVLIIYWRVASLLGITVYLLIGAFPIGYLTGVAARVLIPLSLWFWVDLNEEIDDQPMNSFKLSFLSWRWAITVYNGLGLLLAIPSLKCAVSPQATILADPFCRVWLDAPWGFRAFFHANTKPGFLGFLGIMGLVIYVLYLGYFVFFRLSRQGRSATEQ